MCSRWPAAERKSSQHIAMARLLWLYRSLQSAARELWLCHKDLCTAVPECGWLLSTFPSAAHFREYDVSGSHALTAAFLRVSAALECEASSTS